ncbi:MAG TPA: hypothetical protein PK156_17525 [Polyangium sp.]|nr:hypothetical protein [Polyangium sp.]
MVTIGSPNNRRLQSAALLLASSSLFFASVATADGSRGSRATTDAQAEEKKEEAGVRVLGTSGLENPDDPILRPVKAERRTVLAMGISIGASLGSAAGFPNDPTKIGLISNYTDSGLGAGFSTRAWAGFALRDFLVFGASFGAFGFDAGDNVAFLGTVGFHTEVFPLFGMGGAFREFGLALETGIGTGIVSPGGTTTNLLVDGGYASSIGGSAFYEGFRLGPKLSMGPYIGYDYVWSTSLRGGAFVLGWRTALYPLNKKQ